ncbi:uncharacterized protein LY89DRAFT_685330 [Mollisia scopiformis]|uniref:Uncharacterized protein n=1 Tax=Mollisia scopiformis TaxID=149040 RepID=A0A194X878_MOLSC|nr:uncharacterized protein LY89DRAFT_685330 [Mollisia scopiformis]KUJ16319.1 hypothetical protein LY89DRAFT_685330 [Mollisia scopiformis]
MNAFNTCNIKDAEETWDPFALCLFVNLGPIQSFLSSITNFRRSRRQRKESLGSHQRTVARSEHRAELEDEMYHRHQADRLIDKLRDKTQAASERRKEIERRRGFENKHNDCVYCMSATISDSHITHDFSNGAT